MSGPTRLTPELQQQILASVRAGGYAHVSAQAWGVPEKIWERWLRAGRRPGASEPYRSFYRAVQQAKAQARLKAEIAALDKDARFWLKNGPGREPPPGWASDRKADTDSAVADPFRSVDFMQFMATLRAVLAPYPEALAALAEAVGFESETPPGETRLEDEKGGNV